MLFSKQLPKPANLFVNAAVERAQDSAAQRQGRKGWAGALVAAGAGAGLTLNPKP